MPVQRHTLGQCPYCLSTNPLEWSSKEYGIATCGHGHFVKGLQYLAEGDGDDTNDG